MTNFKKYILVLLSCFQLVGFSQDWEHWYGKEGNNVSGIDVFEHYDKGYVLSGIIWSEDVFSSSSWLIKTDVNGDTLWSKILMADQGLLLTGSSWTSDGGMLLTGNVIKSNPDESFPFAIKLNACGEKEWCTLIDLDEDVSRGIDIIEMPDGNIGFLVYTRNQRDIYLYKLDENGDILWKTNVCSRDNHPDSRVPIPNKMSVTENGDFIIAGDVYWKNPWDDLYPTRNLFAKVSANGDEEWVLPFGLNDGIKGIAYNILEKPDESLIGLGFYWPDNKANYYNNQNSINYLDKDIQDYSYANGMIMHMDKDGNELDYFIADFSEIDTNYRYQKFTSLQYIDSVAIIGGVLDNDIPINNGEITIDTNFFDDNFNVYYKNKHDQLSGLYRSSLTYNNKVLFPSTDLTGDNRIYLTKLNQNLAQDSIYTAAYTYDSLCSQTIASGFIYFNDCNIITALNTPTPKEYQASKQKILLSIYPNPTSEQLTIEMENTSYYHNFQLQIVDIMGVPIFEAIINNHQQEFKLNVKQWQNGLYLVQIIREGKLVGSGRFLKM